MSRDQRPVSVELMRTLDEKYIANVLAFESMWIAATLVVSGAGLRRVDGSVDRAKLRALAEAASYKVPAMRQRLRNAPLGLTTPGWVPVDVIDMTYHMKFREEVVDDGFVDDDLWAGRSNGPVSFDRPLWDMLVVDLASGDIAIVARMQHVVGDGVYALRILDALTDSMSEDLPRPWEVRAPRGPVEFFVLPARKWLDDQADVAAGWQEYWRKPFSKRMRRWGGRLLRPIKNARIAKSDMRETMIPRRRSRFRTVQLQPMKALARQSGSSLNDVLVAATMLALLEVHPEVSSVPIVVPISRRVGRGGDERNHMSILRVEAERGADLLELIAYVHERVTTAVETGETFMSDGDTWLGYASYLPWRVRPVDVGGGPIRSLAFWPTMDAKEELAVFGTVYSGGFTVAMTASRDIDIDRVLDSVCRCIVSEPQTVHTAVEAS